MAKNARIIGAGIGGLTAAHTLRAHGWECEIFEQAEAFGEVGAGLQLSPNATRILRRLGLLEEIRAQSFEPRAATIRDGRTGRTYMYAPLRGFGERVYGAPYLHIYRPRLHEILREGLEVKTGKRVTEFDKAGPDLVVGADGIRSAAQSHINECEEPRFTGQVAWRGVAEASAELRKLIPAEATVWAGPGAHVVTYYLSPDRLNFVAVTEQSDWQEEGWDLPGPIAELQEQFRSWRPALLELFAACGQTRRWALFDRPPLRSWHRGSLALLGDAAHPMLPFLAQGAAQAIEDAWALAEHAPNLAAYEAARRPRASRLQAWAWSNANLYHQTRAIDRLKLLISRGLFRGPQAHILMWQIFSG